jgi:glycine cleavage system H lipoate-binding protein
LLNRNKIANMKNLLLFAAFLMVIHTGVTTGQKSQSEPSQSSLNSVSVTTAPETESLISLWINGFESANPGMKVEVLPLSSSPEADIQFVTGSSLTPGNNESAWKMVVGRDVFIPVISKSNPYLNDVLRTGISPEKFAALMTAEEGYTWGKLLGTTSTAPIAVLVSGDNKINLCVAQFANTGVDNLHVSNAASPSAFMEAISREPGTIGFCRLSDMTEKNGQAFMAGYQIIPIDVNNNGQSDYFEQFYGDFSSFNRGVYIGKYPKTLCNNIFAMASSQPAGGAGSALLRYILADGQPAIAASGYTALAEGEGLIRREALTDHQAVAATGNNGSPLLRSAIWILAVILGVSLVSYLIYRYTKSGVNAGYINENAQSEAFSEKSLIVPGGVLFGRSHTWAFMEKDGAVRVGIDDFLQHVTGTITRVRMKSPGEKVLKGDHILSLVQKGKQLDIQSPVSGTITSVNDKLTVNTSVINSSPFNEGWVYTIEPDNWIQESHLMAMAGKYIDRIKGEFTQLKDFLASLPGVSSERYASVVLQDGGELKDGLLEEFGPEIWEEFQIKFIDTLH